MWSRREKRDPASVDRALTGDAECGWLDFELFMKHGWTATGSAMCAGGLYL